MSHICSGRWCTIHNQWRNKKFRDTVSLVSVDNPASQAIGGFKENPTAFKKCRICRGTNSDIQANVR